MPTTPLQPDISQWKYLLATTLVQSVSLSPEVDEQIQIIASVMFML